MKKFLLLILCFLAMSATAQITATQPANMYECGENAVDLYSQTSAIIGTQNPSSVAVTYYLNESNAANSVNPLPSTLSYSGSEPVTIYVRVDNISNSNDSAFTSFKVLWNTPEYMINVFDITVCNYYVLPELVIRSYHTGPEGSGDMLLAGDYISNSTMIYILVGDEECYNESPFFVFINTPPVYTDQLTACTANPVFDLNQSVYYSSSPVFFYETAEDAFSNINAIINTNTYTGFDAQLLYLNTPYDPCITSNVQTLMLHVIECTGITISGTVRLSSNGTDCSLTDPGVQGITISNEQNGAVTYAYTNAEGHYEFNNVLVGTASVNVAGTYPGMYSMTTPYVQNVTMEANLVDDFCLTQVPFTDASVTLYPMSNARPGVSSQYLLRVFNGGNTSISGTVTLTYDVGVFTFVTSDVAPTNTAAGQLTFSYTALASTQSVSILVTFNASTTAALGQAVSFVAQLTSADSILENNTAVVNQTIVNSFDPNDLLVAEGPFITEVQADGYLHYTINFQNMGTADAIDVRVENELSALLDWSTFRPVSSSHDYFAERTNGSVNFRFNGINLPAEMENEAASHGFITYEIKPVSTLALGEIIENQASIYFDFNEAIVTNGVTTQIQNLGLSGIGSDAISIYPNPVKGKVFISGVSPNSTISLSDLSGKQLILQNPEMNGNGAAIDVSALSAGIYLMKLTSGNQSTTRKLIIK